MFRRILVPLDGSARAERAIPIAISLAKASGGSITLLYVVPTPVDMVWEVPEPPSPEREIASGEKAKAKDYLARIAASNMLSGIVTTTEVFEGIPAAVIVNVARFSQADIIIIYSHGYKGMTSRVLGSVAERVALRTQIPVFILWEGGQVLHCSQSGKAGRLRMLVPLDGSTRAEDVIESAAHLVAALTAPGQGSLHLFRVLPDGQEGSNDISARNYLDSLAKGLRTGHLSPVFVDHLSVAVSTTFASNIASAIIEEAKEAESTPGNCTIIAMATHGLSGLQPATMGSITQRVSRSVRLPMLIVRPMDIIEQSLGSY